MSTSSSIAAPILWLQSVGPEQRGECWAVASGARIGRKPGLEVVLAPISVSRYHAEVTWQPDGWSLRDLGSRNGTRVNGVPLLREQVLLQGRDVVQFSSVSARVVLVDAAAAHVQSSFQAQQLVADVATACGAARVDLYLIDPNRVGVRAVAHQAGVQDSNGFGWQGEDGVATDVVLVGDARLQGEQENDEWVELAIPAQAVLWVPLQSHEGLRQGVLRIERPQSSWTNDALELEYAEEEFRDALQRYDVFDAPALAHAEAAWLWANDHAVERLASALRVEQDFAVLPILADALEDAGCADTHLLAHCRAGRAHQERCWVLDLLARAGS